MFIDGFIPLSLKYYDRIAWLLFSTVDRFQTRSIYTKWEEQQTMTKKKQPKYRRIKENNIFIEFYKSTVSSPLHFVSRSDILLMILGEIAWFMFLFLCLSAGGLCSFKKWKEGRRIEIGVSVIFYRLIRVFLLNLFSLC